jgi:hypothetical protein
MSNQAPRRIWNIGLSAWIIQDGNYSDFMAGQTVEFAVEFHRDSSTDIGTSGEETSANCTSDATYDVVGECVLQSDDLTVLDIGILVYCERDSSPILYQKGRRFRASLYLGVDPFFYFERLAQFPDVPALVYSWRIESIFRQTAPFIESIDDSGGIHGRKILVRDETKSAWEQVSKTDAWTDDGGHAEYLLHCELLPVPRKHTSATAT